MLLPQTISMQAKDTASNSNFKFTLIVSGQEKLSCRALNFESQQEWMAHIHLAKERLRQQDPLAHIKMLMSKSGRRNAVFKAMEKVGASGSEDSLKPSTEHQKPRCSKTAKGPNTSNSHHSSQVSSGMFMYPDLMHTYVRSTTWSSASPIYSSSVPHAPWSTGSSQDQCSVHTVCSLHQPRAAPGILQW